MIKLNDEFEFDRDQYGWRLYQWSDVKSKTGKRTRRSTVTYHATLTQVADAILDRSAGGCESMSELRDLFVMHSDRLLESLRTKVEPPKPKT